MKQRGEGDSLKSNSSSGGRGSDDLKDNNVVLIAKRPTYVVLALFVLVIYGGWGVYHYQFERLPAPLALEQVGKRGFSENEAVKHVEALTRLGPHPVGSEALESAVKYVSEAAKVIQKTAHWEVNVEVDLFHVKSGVNTMGVGLFEGKTVVYSDLDQVILRITPKYAPEAGERAILVSSHIDTVFAGPGAGDDTSSVAVMLELARGVSQCAQGFKHAVIFLFNTGEEEGLNGAHSFITQHPWSDTVQIVVDLEAMGLGGKSTIFQAGPHPWAVEIFASVAKYPTAQIVAEDVFYSGAINSGTDFEIYKNLGGLSGLDFAYLDKTAVYHTKNDKLDLLKSGSLQHLGENMLAFLLHAAASPSLPESKPVESDLESNQERAIYFDILGTYMITFRQRYATVLYNSVILQSLLLWAASLAMGGYSAAISLALSCLSLVLMWIFSIGFSTVVAFILPTISYSPVPYISNPWLVLCLFGAPALLGAFIGQHVGYIILKSYLARTFIERRYLPANLHTSLAKFDAERWLYKSGLVQWLVLLMLGTYYKIGSSYLALAWLASPAFAYGFLEATLSPTRLPKPLKTATLLIGLSVPFILSSGLVIRLSATIIGYTVRFVRNPGSTPEWLENVVVAIFIAACVCLTLVYLLSYVHISGAKVPLIIATSFLSVVSLLAVWGGVVPPFTEDTARAVNVVHVVDARGVSRVNPKPVSYISMFSVTSGDLIKEADHTGEGFVCGRDRYIDFVTFSVNYSCWTDKSAETGWLNSEVPAIYVAKDTRGENRETQIVIETRISTRWALAINTGEIEDFQMKGTANSSDTDSEELIPLGEKSSVDGWHTIQFSGGRKSPTKFQLSLFWSRNGTQTTSARDELLLRFRADVVDTVTPPVENILRKLPLWCSLYGKSSSPHTVAFLSNLPVSLQVK